MGLQEELRQVEDEFRDWARKFAANREGKLLVLEQEALSSAQTQLEYSNRVRPIYAEIVSKLRGYLQAHISESGVSDITVDLPDFPENIYREGYAGTVVFGDTVSWEVGAAAGMPPRDSPPTLVIEFKPRPEHQLGGTLVVFSLEPERGEVSVFTMGAVPSVDALPDAIPEESPSLVIAQVLQSLLAGQLLR